MRAGTGAATERVRISAFIGEGGSDEIWFHLIHSRMVGMMQCKQNQAHPHNETNGEEDRNPPFRTMLKAAFTGGGPDWHRNLPSLAFQRHTDQQNRVSAVHISIRGLPALPSKQSVRAVSEMFFFY